MTPPPPSDLRNVPDFQSEDELPDNAPSGRDPRLKTKRLILDLLSRWYWIVLGLIIGVLASSYYLSKAPKKYKTSATLLIKQQTSAVLSRDQAEEIDVRSSEGLNTVIERIRRGKLLERVAARPDVRSLPNLIPSEIDWRPKFYVEWTEKGKKTEPPPAVEVPEPKHLAGWIGSWMTVNIRGRTRLIDISIEHRVPEAARVLADAVASEYLAEVAGAMSEGRSSKSDTLLKQSEEVRGKLQAAESALATYNRALELHRALETQENSTAQIARRYKEKHPRLIAAVSELDGLKSRFLEEFGIARRALADESYWKTAGQEIEASKEDQDSRLKVARQLLLARTGVLQGEISSQMSVFNTILTRLEESNINREGEDSNAEVHSYARLPSGTSSPNAKKIRTNGVTFGLAAGLAVAFLFVRLDNKFHSVAQVEFETGQHVLAAISDIDIRYLDQAIRNYHKKHAESAVNSLQEDWDPRLVFRSATSATNFAEMFRILRASISLLGDETKRKITLFSSALPGEGKSLVASNFALAAAGQGRRTLLIDLDLRKPSVHQMFGRIRSELGPGVTEWLAGQVALDHAIERDVGAADLHVMFCGKRAPNPGELLNVTRLKQLFAEACERYDLVVVDSAPLLAVPDTRVIAKLVDNFCLVVRANFGPRGATQRALEQLASTNIHPSGLVFNGYKECRHRIGENYSYGSYSLDRRGRPYRYGYGANGSYGAYGSDESEDEQEIKKRRQRAKKSRNGSSTGTTDKTV